MSARFWQGVAALLGLTLALGMIMTAFHSANYSTATTDTPTTTETQPRDTSSSTTTITSPANTKTPPATDPGQKAVPAGATILGSVDMTHYCQNGWGLHAVLRYPNTYGWRCGSNTQPANQSHPGDQNVSVDDACVLQYGNGAASHYRDYNDADSWFCFRR